jgi:hypothetical protein
MPFSYFQLSLFQLPFSCRQPLFLAPVHHFSVFLVWAFNRVFSFSASSSDFRARLDRFFMYLTFSFFPLWVIVEGTFDIWIGRLVLDLRFEIYDGENEMGEIYILLQRVGNVPSGLET